MLQRFRDGSLTRYELACLAVVLTGAILRLWGIGVRPLWFDETFSWLAARGSWWQLWAATAGDVHPPLYYALLKISMSILGDAEWALRLPSALLSIYALARMWTLSRSFGLSEFESWVAVVVMAFAPFQLQYSQEARMYALLQVLTMELLLALAGRRWAWAAVLCAAGAWTHNYSIIFSASAYALALGRELLRPTLPADGSAPAAPSRVVASALVAALCYSPWAVTLLNQMRYAKSEWWQQPTQPGAIVQTAYQLLFGQSLYDWPMMLGALWACVVIIGAFSSKKDMALKWLVLFTPISALLIEIVYRPIWLPRAMMVIAAPCYLLLGRFIARDRERAVIGALGLMPALLGALMLPYGSPWFAMTSQPMHAIAPWVQAGDEIYHSDEGSWVLFARYFNKPGVRQYILPIPARPLGGLTPSTMAVLGVVEKKPDQRHNAFVIQFAGPMSRDSEVQTVRDIVGNRAPLWRWITPMYDGGVWRLPADWSGDPCFYSICLNANPD